MKRSGTKKSREITAFLYERISRDDNLEGDSYSVANQKKLLTKVAKEMGLTPVGTVYAPARNDQLVAQALADKKAR